MKIVIIIRNRAENIYKKFPRICGYAGRLVFSLCCFFLLEASCGYNALLSNTWTIIVLGIFCAFAPARFLMFIIMGYAVIQIGSLSPGVGIVCAAILAAIYLIYFRFDTRYVYFIFLMPVFAMARLPLMLPLILAAVADADALIVVLLGNLIYYMIRYVSTNAAVISGMVQESEYRKMMVAVNGIFTNSEFLYMLIILAVVFLLVYYMRKLNINQANNLAITAGSGAYMILSITANLLFGTVTAQRLVTIVAGALASGLLAAFIVYMLLPLDYTRVETFEFEDDEYNYYVRAVPKAIIKKESVKVKKINSRKEIAPTKSRENTK